MEILSLEFVIDIGDDGKYVCRPCCNLLKKRKKLKDELQSTNEILKSSYKNQRKEIDVSVKNRTEQAECSTPKKVIVLGSPPPCLGGNSGLFGEKEEESFNKDDCRHGHNESTIVHSTPISTKARAPLGKKRSFVLPLEWYKTKQTWKAG